MIAFAVGSGARASVLFCDDEVAHLTFSFEVVISVVG